MLRVHLSGPCKAVVTIEMSDLDYVHMATHRDLFFPA